MAKKLADMSIAELKIEREIILVRIEEDIDADFNIHMLGVVERKLNGHSEIAAAFGNCHCPHCLLDR